MFGRKRKIAKADELRKQANELQKKQDKLIDKWIQENKGKTDKEQKVIDKKYLKAVEGENYRTEKAEMKRLKKEAKKAKKSKDKEAESKPEEVQEQTEPGIQVSEEEENKGG